MRSVMGTERLVRLFTKARTHTGKRKSERQDREETETADFKHTETACLKTFTKRLTKRSPDHEVVVGNEMSGHLQHSNREAAGAA